MENVFLAVSVSSLMICGGIILSTALQAQTADAIIPLEVLFGNPVKAGPQISPDGRFLAYLAPVNNVLNVWVKTIGTDDDHAVTQDTARGIRRYFWAEDGQHILYLQDKDGDENWRLYGVHLATGAVRDLTPFENVQVQIVDVNKRFPNELLIAMNKEDPKAHDVYHLTISDGALTLRQKNPGMFSSWIADADMRIRGAVVETADGGSQLMVRPDERSEWRMIVAWGPEDSLSSHPVGFNKAGDRLYLLSSLNANTSRLVTIDLSGKVQKTLAEDPVYDVAGVMVNPDSYEIEAAAFIKDRQVWKAFDTRVRSDLKKLAAVQRGELSILSRSRDDMRWVVAYVIDNGPVAYYLYNRSTRKAEFLFYNKPDLKNYSLSLMEPVSFRSRDGYTIHGYITLPQGKDPRKLPMVVNVHGGPWSRDTWGYDPEAQWLANRGYACLQVNFRGSTGYGKRFLNAGDKEWGGKMHDDIVDAVQWAVKKGYADPKRVAIYGGSYGGYAALVGATFTPDLFRCAVDIVGPSNLLTFIRSIPPYWSNFLAALHKRVGNPDTEEAFLRSRSPLFKVDEINIPLLIAQGANDPRVKQAESEQIVSELKRKNIPYEYLLFPDEGHGFARPENRITFYKAAEKFLAGCLSGSDTAAR